MSTDETEDQTGPLQTDVPSPDGPDASDPGQVGSAESADPDALLPTGPVQVDEPVDEAAEALPAVLDPEVTMAPEPVVDEAVVGEPVDEAADERESADEPTDGVVDEDELLESEPEPIESPYDRPGRWYVVHTQSGYEKKVKQNLEARIDSMDMLDRIYEVVIPMEDVQEFKGGKKVIVQKKVFPGYLLVRCRLDDDSWYVIRNTPGIVNFVGPQGKPLPLRRREVEEYLMPKVEGREQPTKRTKARLEFDVGETVRVKEGPFADFSGEIIELNEDQLKVKVLVNIFGRETPVELEFSQVARL